MCAELCPGCVAGCADSVSGCYGCVPNFMLGACQGVRKFVPERAGCVPRCVRVLWVSAKVLNVCVPGYAGCVPRCVLGVYQGVLNVCRSVLSVCAFGGCE